MEYVRNDEALMKMGMKLYTFARDHKETVEISGTDNEEKVLGEFGTQKSLKVERGRGK